MPAGHAPLNTTASQPLPGDHLVENGRLKCASVTPDDRNIAVAAHLSLLSGLVLGPFAFLLPLAFWFSNKDRSAYRADHCTEALNVGITGGLVTVALGFLWWLIIPLILGGVWLIVAFIGMIRAASAANKNEYFRYPMTIRFLS
jgi:uncharacterized Tic20 family protein